MRYEQVVANLKAERQNVPQCASRIVLDDGLEAEMVLVYGRGIVKRMIP